MIFCMKNNNTMTLCIDDGIVYVCKNRKWQWHYYYSMTIKVANSNNIIKPVMTIINMSKIDMTMTCDGAHDNDNIAETTYCNIRSDYENNVVTKEGKPQQPITSPVT